MFYLLSCLNRNGKTENNPFDDEREEWDDYSNDVLVDNGEPGVPVKALYDYEGAEADELSFKQGINIRIVQIQSKELKFNGLVSFFYQIFHICFETI